MLLINKREKEEHLEKALTDLVTSITGALSLLLLAAFLVCSETSDQSLSVLTVGQN